MSRPTLTPIPISGQRGQALVETLVLSLALLPLLLAIPLLAKYQDIRHAAIMASRTAAFECSVRFEQCEDAGAQGDMADGLRRRHFARHGRDLLTRDAVADDAPADQRNRFWVDRRGNPLLGRLSDVAVNVEQAASDAVVGAWGSAATPAGRGARAFSDAAGPGAFGLDVGGGLMTTRVRARVSLGKTMAQWLAKPEGIALALTGKTAVLVDAWNASSAEGNGLRSFASRVEEGRKLPTLGDGAALLSTAFNAAPIGSLGALGSAEPEDAFDLLYTPVRELITGPLLAPFEPRGKLFRYHEIDVEIVPADRIGKP